MRTTKFITQTLHKRSFYRIAVLLVFAMVAMSASFAAPSEPRTFSSPEQATSALFRALQNDDEPVLELILGAGKEVASSSDEVQDQLEREQFRKKYQEMHRIVREPDGTAVLYVGAENWPFPIPLVSKNGRWFFDSDAGIEEIQLRRVGENETTAIHVCADFQQAKKQQGHATANDAVSQYALNLVSTEATDTHTVTKAGPAKQPSPFHGYYFRAVTSTPGRKNADAAVALVAYPVEYRSTGVMTLIVTRNGGVYEKDLGPHTEKVAKTLTVRKGSTWHPVQSTEVPNK